jgi:hypothetical protein
MSYTLTLDMPLKAVRFVERQAMRHGTDFSALFVDFLHEQFGFGECEDVEATVQGFSEDEGTLTRSLSGIVSLPEGTSDKDMIAAAMLEKYASLT